MRRVLAVLVVAGVWAVTAAGGAPAANVLVPGKAGGTLNVLTREDLTEGFSIHESVTISTMWPAQPCFNNLVMFDPAKPLEGFDTVVPELAERWSWQDGYRSLVVFLRRGVKWRDAQPFSARDVKFTFDMVREAPESTAKLRLSPRRDWYANVEAIDTPDAHTVVFRLRRPQPSRLLRPARDRRSTPPTFRRRSSARAAWGRARSGCASGSAASTSTSCATPTTS